MLRCPRVSFHHKTDEKDCSCKPFGTARPANCSFEAISKYNADVEHAHPTDTKPWSTTRTLTTISAADVLHVGVTMVRPAPVR